MTLSIRIRSLNNGDNAIFKREINFPSDICFAPLFSSRWNIFEDMYTGVTRRERPWMSSSIRIFEKRNSCDPSCSSIGFGKFIVCCFKFSLAIQRIRWKEVFSYIKYDKQSIYSKIFFRFPFLGVTIMYLTPLIGEEILSLGFVQYASKKKFTLTVHYFARSNS